MDDGGRNAENKTATQENSEHGHSHSETTEGLYLHFSAFVVMRKLN